jgi:hypothetical protein
MRKIARSDVIFVSLCLVSLLFGCAPELSRQVTPASQPGGQAIPPLQLEGLDRKIASLEKVLQREDLSKEDRTAAQNLLVAYGAIREDLKYPLMTTDYQKIIGLLYSNLAQMDENYFKRLIPPGAAEAQSFQLFSEKEKKIISSYSSGDYQAVVDGCVGLEKDFGANALPPDIALLYALSLGETGKYAEALSLSQTLGPEIEKTPGFIQLQAKSVEWQLALGEKQAALDTYHKLIDRLKAQETLVKLAEQKLPSDFTKGAVAQAPSEGAGTPSATAAAGVTSAPAATAAAGTTSGPAATTAAGATSAPATTAAAGATGITAATAAAGAPAVAGEATPKEPETTAEVLKRADELAHNGEYDKAKVLLLQQRLRVPEGPETEAIDKELENLEVVQTPTPAAEAMEQQMAASQETIKTAWALIQEEKFEDALAKLEELQQKQPLSQEAQNLQALAIEKIITRERNKAARLFLLARNTADPAKKQELLQSSYDILKAVAEKFPASPLNKKINDNMRSIEVELSKIKKQTG